MIINSPVGRFPFTATNVEIRSGRIRLEGDMGTWPTSVEVRVAELPGILGQLLNARTVALYAVAGVAALVAVRRLRHDAAA